MSTFGAKLPFEIARALQPAGSQTCSQIWEFIRALSPRRARDGVFPDTFHIVLVRLPREVAVVFVRNTA